MFFINPWGHYIANGTMPSLDFDSTDDKDYLKKQIIALSFMTFSDVLIIVLSIIVNIIWVMVGMISFNSYKYSEKSIVTEENVEEILPEEK